MNNIGRPKKEGLDKVIKFTVSEKEAELFDSTIKETGKSKSDILRELFPIVSSQDFEGLIPNTKMEILQSYSEKCWDILHTPNCIFEVNNLSDRMPAFLGTIQQPTVYVKYPTYKIQILCNGNPTEDTDEREIEELLEPVKNRSQIYSTRADFILVGGRLKEMSFPYVKEVMCLGVTLEDNKRCKNEIVERLKDSKYHASIYAAFCYREMKVELLEEGKYFKVL